MNSFFKTFFASLLAVIVSGLLFIFVVFGIIGILASSFTKSETTVNDNSILKITLSETISDKPSESPFAGINPYSFTYNQSIVMLDILNAIAKAKDDDKIKGIYLNLSPTFSLGTANVEEIRSALKDFSQSGKFIVSYNNFYSQGAYYLSSIADQVYMNPEGTLLWKGMSSEVMFFKGALDKLGVKPEIIRHGKYKGAVEPFILDKLSTENREQISSFVGSIWGGVVADIALSRGVDSMQLQDYASSLAISSADEAIAKKLINGTLYSDEVEALLAEKIGEEKPKFISLSDYILSGVSTSSSDKVSQNKIAIIYAEGDIVDGKGDVDNIGGDKLAATISKARKDDKVKAVVLRVNSGGGSALASEVIWREMSLTQSVKPVIVSMGNVAASGGYYISAPADMIVASPATITGSIGVFGMTFDVGEGAKEKLGLTVDVVSTNKYGDMGNIFRPLSAPEREFILKGVERVYVTFTNRVAAGRNLPIPTVDSIAGGRVWSGAEALENGLVDGYGTLRDAIFIAADKAGVLSDFRTATFNGDNDKLTQLVSMMSGVKAFVMGKPNFIEQEYKNVINLMQGSTIKTIMPYKIEIQ